MNAKAVSYGKPQQFNFIYTQYYLQKYKKHSLVSIAPTDLYGTEVSKRKIL